MNKITIPKGAIRVGQKFRFTFTGTLPIKATHYTITECGIKSKNSGKK